MKPHFEYGEEVRLTRNVRNDGTYPGMEVGSLLIRRGAVGCVYDVGTYLQDQIIYRVHFLDEGRTVGCREEELISASDPWLPNKFEFREKVMTTMPLSVGGHVIVESGSQGEVQRVMRESDHIAYHVRFGERTYLVPEQCLADPEASDAAETLTQQAVEGNG